MDLSKGNNIRVKGIKDDINKSWGDTEQKHSPYIKIAHSITGEQKTAITKILIKLKQ